MEMTELWKGNLLIELWKKERSNNHEIPF